MSTEAKKALTFGTFVILIALIAMPLEYGPIKWPEWAQKLTEFRKPLLVYIAMLTAIYVFKKENEGGKEIPPTAWTLAVLIGIAIIDIGFYTLAWLAAFTILTVSLAVSLKDKEKRGTDRIGAATVMAGVMLILLHLPVKHVEADQASS